MYTNPFVRTHCTIRQVIDKFLHMDTDSKKYRNGQHKKGHQLQRKNSNCSDASFSSFSSSSSKGSIKSNNSSVFRGKYVGQ